MEKSLTCKICLRSFYPRNNLLIENPRFLFSLLPTKPLNMKKLIKLSLLAIFLGIHPVSCDKGDSSGTDCGSGTGPIFIASLDLIARDVSIKEHYNFPLAAPPADTSLYYSSDSICLSLLANQTKKSPNKKTSNFSFQSTASACSPLYLYSNPITSFEIIYQGHITDFDDTIPLEYGDTISNLFSFTPDQKLWNTMPLSEISEYPSASAFFMIKLKERNRDSLNLKFMAVATLNTGEVFHYRNQRLKILPSK